MRRSLHGGRRIKRSGWRKLDQGKVQATGGGRLKMGASSGRANTLGAILPGSAIRCMKDCIPENSGGGRVAAVPKVGHTGPWRWLLRWQQSVSAGFWTACKSSVTEITGKRIRSSRVRATNCMRLCVPVSDVHRSHVHSMNAASSTHARLRNNSIRNIDSISATVDGDNRCPGSRVWRCQKMGYVA